MLLTDAQYKVSDIIKAHLYVLTFSTTLRFLTLYKRHKTAIKYTQGDKQDLNTLIHSRSEIALKNSNKIRQGGRSLSPSEDMHV